MDRCIISKWEVVLGAPKLYKMKNEMKNNNTPPLPNPIRSFIIKFQVHLTFRFQYIYMTLFSDFNQEFPIYVNNCAK